MGDFDEMYEMGLVDKGGMPIWENYNNKYKNKKNNSLYDKSNFKINKQNGIISLTIDLTPKVFLEAKQLTIREDLEKTNFNKILNLKHNKYNNNDNFALEIYYNEIFIGHVRKKFKYEGIDNTSIINNFCFEGDLLKDLHITYRDHQYIIENINHNTQEEDEKTNKFLAWTNKYNIQNAFATSEILNLSNKQLTYLPEEIGNLTNVNTIYLKGNNLTSLPKGIGKLVNLEVLDLSNNQLVHLPEGIGALTNLEFLNLSNNNLTSLPRGIDKLINLKSLDLKYNKISLSDFQLNLIEKFEKLGCSVYHNIVQLKKEKPPLTFNTFISIIITIATQSFYFLILGLIFYIIGG